MEAGTGARADSAVNAPGDTQRKAKRRGGEKRMGLKRDIIPEK